jgi:hypothetical protein
MATGYNIRVGDADREAIAGQLREHYADGRLTLDELNERLDQAFAAKTRADLNAVLRDLPVTPRPVVPMPSPRSSGSSSRGFAFLSPAIALLWLCLIFGSIFLFGFGDKPFIVVVVLAALALLRRIFGRRGRGGGKRRGRR